MRWVCRTCGWSVPDCTEAAYLATLHSDKGHDVQRVAVECRRLHPRMMLGCMEPPGHRSPHRFVLEWPVNA